MDTNWLAEIPAYAMEYPYLAAALGLLPSVNKGVSKAADLLMAPLVREKARRDMLSRAQTEQDIQAIKEGRAHFDGKNLVPAMPELTPLHDYQPSWQGLPPQQLPMAAALQEEGENLYATLSLAMEELARTPDDKVSDKAVDKDWFSRWRAEARLVTSDELRRMWARILVEEVKEPEAVSLKTLDVLKNLTKSDIEVFKTIARWHIHGLIYINIKWSSASDIDKTKECTVLQDRELLSEATRILHPIRYNNITIVRCHGVNFEIESRMIKLKRVDAFQLSFTAQELLNIADDIPYLSNEESIYIGDFIVNLLVDKVPVRAVRISNNEIIHVWNAENNIE